MNGNDVVPPIFTKIIAKLFRRKDASFLEKKEFPSYQLAENECQKSAYQDVELCDVIADKTVAFRDQSNSKQNLVNSSMVFLLAAICDSRVAKSSKSMTILDFGGACGAHYFEIKSFYQ